MAPDPKERLNTNSYISISLAIGLIVGAVGLWREMGAVRQEIAPTIATIEERVRNIADSLNVIRADYVKSDRLEAELRALRAEMDTRLRALEKEKR